MTGEEIWQNLLEGNARFVNNKMTHPNMEPGYRVSISEVQRPKAVILSCADSRIPPEIIFDQGLGDLFTIRLAGNVASDEAIGSIEFGAKYLGIPLVVVLGHKNCVAVLNACKGYNENDHVRHITKILEPAVERAKKMEGNLYDNAVDENIKIVIEKLKQTGPVLKPLHDEGKLAIIGAHYDMKTGIVETVEYPVNVNSVQ